MPWNYRLVRRKHENEVTFGIHTAFYNEGEDRPHSIGTEPLAPIGETRRELAEEIDRFREALRKPFLEHSDYTNR